MAYQNIVVETRGKIGIIRLNRPQALNALNAALIGELTQAVQAFEADADIACMVVTGSEKAFAAGGSSLRDHRRTDGELGEFQHNFRVYDREGERCVTPGCPGTVKRIVQGGRSTFFCPVCQK